MQKFHIGSDSDSDPLIKIYVVGTEICPKNGYSNHLGNHLSRDPLNVNMFAHFGDLFVIS